MRISETSSNMRYYPRYLMNNMKTKLSENSLFGASGHREIMEATAGPPPTKASKQKAKQQALLGIIRNT